MQKPSPSTRTLVTVFTLIYFSYVVSYLCRKNYSFWFSTLLSIKDGNPNMNDMDSVKSDDRYARSASLFGSTMEIAYGAGKLLAGPIADMVPSTQLLSLSILISALCNSVMFTSGMFYVDIGLWAVNGFAQSFAWPALAMVFMNFFKHSQYRGTLYSILSTNQNVGSALSPIILTPLTAVYGWKSALQAPAVIGVVYAALLLMFLQDSPDAKKSEVKKESSGAEGAKGTMEIMKDMLLSPWVWSLGAGYAFLTIIRVSIADWTMVIIRDVHHLPIEVGRDCLVALELGGFVGGLAAGLLSDRLFGGRRGPIIVIFTLITVPSSMAIILSATDLLKDHIRLILVALYFVCGFGGFGPHMLVGLAAREIFPKAQSTAGAFTKSLGQLGGAFAGYPLSQVVAQYGWTQVAYLWGVCGLLSALSFSPMLFVGSGFLEQAESASAPATSAPSRTNKKQN